jgi:hypothetical protein
MLQGLMIFLLILVVLWALYHWAKSSPMIASMFGSNKKDKN